MALGDAAARDAAVSRNIIKLHRLSVRAWNSQSVRPGFFPYHFAANQAACSATANLLQQKLTVAPRWVKLDWSTLLPHVLKGLMSNLEWVVIRICSRSVSWLQQASNQASFIAA